MHLDTQASAKLAVGRLRPTYLAQLLAPATLHEGTIKVPPCAVRRTGSA